jgi:outer membrane protein OmpA-like peptidoglycan-associated protein
MQKHSFSLSSLALFAFTAFSASAETPSNTAAQAPPSSLFVYFDLGSASIRTNDRGVLDQASRLYREGKPIVMVVSGSTDSSGTAPENLRLSQRRADAVLHGLVSRGIPLERFQIVAKGATDPAVPTAPGASEERNRRVEITWR